MAKTHYEVERTGQMDFFDNYGIDYQNDNSILVDDTMAFIKARPMKNSNI